MDAQQKPYPMKDRFLSEIAPDGHFDRLFDLLPGISFFAKNRDLQIMAANRRFWERLAVNSEAEIIGKNDFDLFRSMKSIARSVQTSAM